MSRAGLDRLHAAMLARVERKELPGMVILVAQNEDVHVDAIGVKAFDSTEPMRRDTLFRIASMTKPVLAAATMLLVEEGKLALDEPVDTWLPELANRRVLRHIDGPLEDTAPANRPITLDDLLTFRMGFGQIVEPTFDPPYPIVKAGHDLELGLVSSRCVGGPRGGAAAGRLLQQADLRAAGHACQRLLAAERAHAEAAQLLHD
jgi:CubicO group peptidase (beta-lactamase class C family)